jgi:hypothetical protein
VKAGNDGGKADDDQADVLYYLESEDGVAGSPGFSWHLPEFLLSAFRDGIKRNRR